MNNRPGQTKPQYPPPNHMKPNPNKKAMPYITPSQPQQQIYPFKTKLLNMNNEHFEIFTKLFIRTRKFRKEEMDEFFSEFCKNFNGFSQTQLIQFISIMIDNFSDYVPKELLILRTPVFFSRNSRIAPEIMCVLKPNDVLDISFDSNERLNSCYIIAYSFPSSSSFQASISYQLGNTLPGSSNPTLINPMSFGEQYYYYVIHRGAFPCQKIRFTLISKEITIPSPIFFAIQVCDRRQNSDIAKAICIMRNTNFDNQTSDFGIVHSCGAQYSSKDIFEGFVRDGCFKCQKCTHMILLKELDFIRKSGEGISVSNDTMKNRMKMLEFINNDDISCENDLHYKKINDIIEQNN